MSDDESLQRAIDQPVALEPYDARWPRLFEDERGRLAALLPHELLDVQHIGSTAVPDLVAKPIIDILAGVASMRVADALVAPLLANGYTTSAAYNATLTDRRWFMRFADGRRTHHLHVVVLGGMPWRERLRFRDALRVDAPLAGRYAELKQSLAARHPDDREAYTRAKEEFVRAVVDATS